MDFIKNRNYVLLLAGNAVSRLGNVIYNVILSWWITEKTGNPIGIGYILAASSLGNVLMSPYGGVLADSIKKKYIIVFTDIISGITTIYIACLIQLDVQNVWYYVAGSFILGVCSAAFRPSIRAILPYLCKEEHIVKSNSLINNLGELSNIIGPSIGAALMLLGSNGAFYAILIDGLSFLFSALSETFIMYEEEKGNTDGNAKFLSAFIDGCKAVKGHYFIWLSIVMVSLINFCLASFEVLLPSYVLNLANSSENVYSNLLTVYAVGGVLVSLFMIAAKNLKVNFNKLCFSIIIIGIALSIFGTSKNIFLSGFIVCILGACETYFSTNFFSILQVKIEKEYLGRVFSIVFTISMLLTPVSNIFYGHLGKRFLELSFVCSGIFVVFFAMIYLIKGKRSAE